jgi:hypothetical protein
MRMLMTKKSAGMFLLLLGAALPTGYALGATATVPALKDSMIFGTSAGADTGNASGNGPALFAGADGSSNKKRSLIEFNVASANIPADATIQSVTMTLYLAQVAGSGGGSGGGGNYPSRTLRLFDLSQDWSEGSSGLPTSTSANGSGSGYMRMTGDSTWDYASYDSTNLAAGKWNAGGMDVRGGNFASTESGSSTFISFTTLNAPFTWSSAGMVSDVQGWVNGSTSNFGWLLKSDLETSPTSFLGFWSKDGAAANSNPGIAPSLTITYSLPEPTGASLVICITAVWCVRKPRKN